MALGNRPFVYGQQTGIGGMNKGFPNRPGVGGLQFGARPGGGLGGNRFMEPTLDLTSGMMEMDGQDIRDSDGYCSCLDHMSI